METQKSTSQQSFEKINKNIINMISSKDELAAFGLYCWLKANCVFTNNYKIKIGYTEITLNENEFCYSESFLAKKYNMSRTYVRTLMNILKDKEMISIVNKIKTDNYYSIIYRVNFFLTTNKTPLSPENTRMSQEDRPLSPENTRMSPEDQRMSPENRRMSPEDQRMSQEIHNNKTINNTINNNKKENINYHTVTNSFSNNEITSDDLINYKDVLFDNEEELNEEIKKNSSIIDKQQTSVKQLSDNEYYKIYGKSKPEKEVDRQTLINNEWYMFLTTIKNLPQSVKEEKGLVDSKNVLNYFKENSKFAPTIKEAIEAVKNAKNSKKHYEVVA